VSLVRDAGRVVVVDPGMVADRELILRPLRELGVAPEEVTDVVLSHHHLDHTLNVALFPVVPVHDFQSVIEGDVFTRRAADGVDLTPSVRLLATPGTPRRTSRRWSARPTTSSRSPTCGGPARARPTTPTPPTATSCGASGSGCSSSPRSSSPATARPSARATRRPAERARAGCPTAKGQPARGLPGPVQRMCDPPLTS
jgi:hypothetical protein